MQATLASQPNSEMITTTTIKDAYKKLKENEISASEIETSPPAEEGQEREFVHIKGHNLIEQIKEKTNNQLKRALEGESSDNANPYDEVLIGALLSQLKGVYRSVQEDNNEKKERNKKNKTGCDESYKQFRAREYELKSIQKQKRCLEIENSEELASELVLQDVFMDSKGEEYDQLENEHEKMLCRLNFEIEYRKDKISKLKQLDLDKKRATTTFSTFKKQMGSISGYVKSSVNEIGKLKDAVDRLYVPK